MLDFPEADRGIGVHMEGKTLVVASVFHNKQGVVVEWVKCFDQDEDNVKPLYNQVLEDGEFSAICDGGAIVSVLDGKSTLLRKMKLQLKKRKDIDAVFAFEAEPLLPYPVEDALIDKVSLSKTKEGTTLLLFSTKKEDVAAHLERWHAFGFEPEAVIPAPMALGNFAKFYFPGGTCFLGYLGEEETCLILMREGQLIASQTASCGLKDLREALKEDALHQDKLSLNLEDLSFSKISSKSYPNVFGAIKRWQNELLRMVFGLEKFLDGAESKELVLVGPGTTIAGLSPLVVSEGFELKQVEYAPFAMSIGAALSPLALFGEQASARQGLFAYPDPWKRLKLPLETYGFLVISLIAACLVLGHVYSEYKLDEIRQDYAELLEKLNKPHLEVEQEFAKNEENTPVEDLRQLGIDDLQSRLSFLENKAIKTPDLFPLQPNVPLVSDVLAWLGRLSKEVDGDTGGLHLESFNYTVVKRPEQTKRREKYQVKVELEFTSPTQQLARKIHDALITPNTFIDPKGEVKWNASRERYRTSFYLKDKTNYS